MEKEQKKLLLVAVSVGVFLLITITAAVIILTPKVSTEGAAFSAAQPIPPITPPAAGNNQITVQPPANGDIADNRDAVVSGNNNLINIPIPTTAAIPSAPEVPPPGSRTITPVAPARTTAAPQPAPAPAAQPARTTQPAARTTQPAPAPAPRAPRTVNDFWVQTGAFSAMVKAEEARETLASKGITSIIENRQIDGRTWYRVRLGPYTSENEANYWLALVKTIDGFEGSQVRQTIRQQ